MQINSVGIDLGKDDLSPSGSRRSRQGASAKKVQSTTVADVYREPAYILIGLEACSGAHFLGRALRKQGQDVRLIAAQFVKPF